MQEVTETILSSKEQIYTTVLVSLWIFSFLSNLIIAKIVKGEKKKWGDFWAIWFWTAFIMAIVIGFMIFASDQIFNFINWLKDFFNQMLS